MTSDPQVTERSARAAVKASQAIAKLLERITATVQEEHISASPQVLTDLTELIERVREQYLILANRQVQAALETVLALDQDANGPPSQGSSSAPPRHDEALDALEALISGRGEESAGYEADEQSDAESAEDPVSEDLLEGTVRLQVYPGGSLQRVLKFVEAMGKRPQFRVLRVSGNPQREGAEIDLGLREPLPLLAMLLEMGHSAEPGGATPEGIPVLTVHLNVAEVA